MLVIVQDANDDVHARLLRSRRSACSAIPSRSTTSASITAPTQLVASRDTFGTVDFGGHARPASSTPSCPRLDPGYDCPSGIKNPRGGRHPRRRRLLHHDGHDTDPTASTRASPRASGAATAFEVTRLADDVEDMQIAYGVDLDGDGRGDAVHGDDACPTTRTPIRHRSASTARRRSTTTSGFPNAAGETALTPDQFQQDATAIRRRRTSRTVRRRDPLPAPARRHDLAARQGAGPGPDLQAARLARATRS